MKIWTFSHKIFQRSLREQVWQSCWKFLLNSPKFLLLLVWEWGKLCFFFNDRFEWTVLGTRQTQLHNLAYNTFAKLLQLFCSKSTNVEEALFLHKKLLTIPLDIWKTLLTFLKKTFVGNPKLFWLNFLKFFPGSSERTNLSPKDHFWRKEKLLKSLLKKKLTKNRTSITQLKKMLKINFSLKMLSSNCSSGQENCSLRDLLETSIKYPNFFLSMF